MSDRAELLRRRSADFLRGRIPGCKIRILPLKLYQLPHQKIELMVADAWVVLFVVKAVMLFYLPAQLSYSFLCFRLLHVLRKPPKAFLFRQAGSVPLL